ncbi:MAG TPA: hypothetical protein VNZ52_15720, partial [Candidatus Thermoplasmatota archaeon]|nr:hypothetical protein [Candidatus Thermoplasmatota archaeon]
MDLASFHVLKETPLEKLGVGYTPRETYLIRKSLTQEEIFRLRRPADVFGEEGERIGCIHCGAVFRLWRRGGEEAVHCFECGKPAEEH